MKVTLTNYVCAVDIGSSKIAATVARAKQGRISQIYCESIPSKSMKEGIVTDSIALVGSLDRILKKLKTKSGINIRSVYLNLSGSEIVAKHSRAVIPLTERGNKVITLADVQKVNEQARILAANLEEEVIHRIPVSYSIDSRRDILNPLGLYSHKLEVDLYLVSAKLSSMQNMGRIVNQAGYVTGGVFFSGLATSRVIFDKDMLQGTNVLCDIGSDITEMLIFKEGVLSDILILPLGGDGITQELANALKIPWELAEETKRTHGRLLDTQKVELDKEILIKKDNIYKTLSQRLICELITSKAKAMCLSIKESLDKRLDLGRINNFTVTGRGVMLEGFLETLENILGTKVGIGRISDPDITSLISRDEELSKQTYLSYATTLGMVCEVLKSRDRQLLPNQQPLIRNPLLKAVNKIKEVYEEYF